QQEGAHAVPAEPLAHLGEKGVEQAQRMTEDHPRWGPDHVRVGDALRPVNRHKGTIMGSRAVGDLDHFSGSVTRSLHLTRRYSTGHRGIVRPSPVVVLTDP